ncbi:MAG TPA: ATP-binding protein [Dongiaceae bacterium]|jgi:two-component system OmpR family sensor kinase/two-component system sensor histidine kinase QseC
MSLRRTFRLWLTVLLLAIGLITAVASYWLAGNEAADYLDNQLRQIALYVWNVPEGFHTDIVPPPHDPEDDFVVQVWDAAGAPIMSSTPAVPIPRGAATGFSEVEVNGEEYRVYTAIDRVRTVQVSQQLEVREELAADASLRATIPIALLIPLSWLVLNWLIGRIIGRLDRVAAKVTEREASGIDPIPADEAPIEIMPLINAMNALVQRLQAALTQQRRFVADAAHELRTPLAAISLQVNNLKAAVGSDGKMAQRLADLEAGSQRASALVGQLLRLARFEAAADTRPDQCIALVPLVMDSLGRFAPLAEHRMIDLGLSQEAAPVVEGVEEEVRALIDNLIDNAIRYTPEGGTVDVILRTDNARPVLEVRDTGPGIPDASLPRVFERFFRAGPPDTEGSGLGLSIAKAAADRNHITFTLRNRADRSGLSAVLIFRAARSKADTSL